MPIKPGVRVVEVVRALDDAGIDAIDVTRREVTLDDVFVTLTGAKPVDDVDEAGRQGRPNHRTCKACLKQQIAVPGRPPASIS